MFVVRQASSVVNTTLEWAPERSMSTLLLMRVCERARAGKMAACALRRGLLSTVSKYSNKHTQRILSVLDSSGGFELNRPRLQCRACGLPGGVQPRRFMSSR